MRHFTEFRATRGAKLPVRHRSGYGAPFVVATETAMQFNANYSNFDSHFALQPLLDISFPYSFETVWLGCPLPPNWTQSQWKLLFDGMASVTMLVLWNTSTDVMISALSDMGVDRADIVCPRLSTLHVYSDRGDDLPNTVSLSGMARRRKAYGCPLSSLRIVSDGTHIGEAYVEDIMSLQRFIDKVEFKRATVSDFSNDESFGDEEDIRGLKGCLSRVPMEVCQWMS
ncbi:hypothetical protein PLICRDRAFT_584132 [Plicaturopsis crispa FD-325 SS-3]|nr:hypothetical protein PLICRDRAFT_584132 [Plicaturopsis crispa FD-325 SS-3]